MKPFNSTGAFQPINHEGDLRHLAVRSAGITVLSQALVFAIQLVSTVILARILTPTDFGLVALVTTFSLLLVSFGLNGFTEAVLQREDVTHFLASNLFWINVSAGLVLSIAFAASGNILAWFYSDPLVTRVAVGLSLTIFLSSTSILHLALMKRAMLFSAAAKIDVTARCVSVLVSILLAVMGWGYWALVAGAVAQPLTTTIGAWIGCRWMPAFPRRAPGTGDAVRFAMNVYGRFTVNYSTRNMDNLLVGWRFGTPALGLYKKAYDLFLLPSSQLLSPVTAVAISTLSRLNNDFEEYKRYFLTGLSILALVGMGMSGVLTLVGKDLIRILLGPGWDTSGRIFTFFGPGVGIMLIYGAHGLIHLSLGKADRWFRWGIIEFAVTGLFFILALHWGPIGIASAWTASFWVLTIPAFWYAGKPINFGVGPVLKVTWRYVIAALVASFVTAMLLTRVFHLTAANGTADAAIRTLYTSALFGILYLFMVIVLHAGYEPLRQIIRLLPHVLPNRFTPLTNGASSHQNMPIVLRSEPVVPQKNEKPAAKIAGFHH